jgi:hypothetical protein
MRVALVLAAVALGAAAPAFATTAQLRLADRAPLTLRGAGFDASERVEVRVKLGDDAAKRFVRADRTGRFLVRFAGLVYDRCHGALVVAAIGARGTRAGFSLQPLECPAHGS